MSQPKYSCDIAIIGAGIVGVTLGLAVLESNPNFKVTLFEKENDVGLHASGRNSGVIHAGFYYSSESLKAKFCHQGNIELRKFCSENKLQIRESGKIVVARDEKDVQILEDLSNRAQKNGVDVELLDISKLADYEPLARTFGKFIWSPATAIGDPKSVITAMRNVFLRRGGKLVLGEKVKKLSSDTVEFESGSRSDFQFCFNASGSGALRIAQNCAVGLDLGLLPVLGGYISIPAEKIPLRTLVYSTPHPLSPFLGIHFTLDLNGRIRIGPTAIPVFGPEQYSFRDQVRVQDSVKSMQALGTYIAGDPVDSLKNLSLQLSQRSISQMVAAASKLVPNLPSSKDWIRGKAGIRSQLVNLKTKKFEQDFIVEKSNNVVHVLNAVSPGWTSAIPFSRWVVSKYLSNSL